MAYECGPRRQEAVTTDVLKTWLMPLLEKYEIRTICDLGCGDLHWFSQLGFDGEYIGYDEVIRKSAKEIAGKNGWRLCEADIFLDDFKACDLAIVKDVFIHYGDAECLKLLRKVKEKARYLCAESHESHEWPRPTKHNKVFDGRRYGCAANATNLRKILGAPFEEVMILPKTKFGPKIMALWDMSVVSVP